MNIGVNKFQVGVVDMTSIYESTKDNVELILRKRYNMSLKDAQEAIAVSPLESIFNENAEMAAHTSNEAWARQVFNYWKKYKS